MPGQTPPPSNGGARRACILIRLPGVLWRHDRESANVAEKKHGHHAPPVTLTMVPTLSIPITILLKTDVATTSQPNSLTPSPIKH